jgi:hypothetical protein
LRLTTDSDLIDAGIDVGLPFSGANPDLGAFEYSDPSAVSKNEQCSAPPNNTPAHFCLGQNYPNPFNPMTTITFELSKSGEIDLCIYNSRGELVSDVINHEYCKMGVHMRNVDLSDCPAGLYVAVLEHNNRKESLKMMLLK